MPKVGYLKNILTNESLYNEILRAVYGNMATKRLKQYEVAHLIGVSYATFSAYKKDGFRKMPFEKFVRMAKVLEFSDEDYDRIHEALKR